MLSLDSTTLAQYAAASTYDARAQAIMSALPDVVEVKVYNSGSLVGSGTMTPPWATIVGPVITIGEISSFTVLTTGTPNPSTWYLRFESGTKWLRGTFGLSGSGADFTWSRPVWKAGQKGKFGTGTIQTPRFDVRLVSFAPTEGSDTAALAASAAISWNGLDPVALANFTEGTADTRDLSVYATIPSGLTPAFTITTQSKGGVAGAYGITVHETTGVLTVPDTVTADDYSVVVDLAASNTAQADWDRRIATVEATGELMWYHGFESDGEVNRFIGRSAIDSWATRQATGGPGGDFPYMKVRVPAGQNAGGPVWLRPLAALPALSAGALAELPTYSAPADPGWSKSSADGEPGGAPQWDRQNNSLYRGKNIYGHPDYWPTGSMYASEWQANGGGTTDISWFAGHDFWLSVAFRCTSTRWQPDIAGVGGGKALWFQHWQSFSGTEVPFREYEGSGGLWAYEGTFQGNILAEPQQSGVNLADGKMSYGGYWDATCLVNSGWYNNVNAGTVGNCFRFPSWPGNVGDFSPYTPDVADESTWTHLLFYWKLGHRTPVTSPPYDPADQDTTLKIWVANAGAWRPMFMFTDRAKSFESGSDDPYGFSAFATGTYHNGAYSTHEWGRDIAQMIFKRGNGTSADPETDGIPCPAAGMT